MDIDLNSSVPIQYLQSPLLESKEIELGILRLDLIHPVVSGNKWFKLKRNIAEATRLERNTILTFGGAYSNHLIATAAAASVLGFKSIGVLRGLDGIERPTETLTACKDLGMQLHFISREEYALKNDAEYLGHLSRLFPDSFVIPEGGDNVLGVQGASEIASFIPDDITDVALPVGTGTTFAGLRNGLPDSCNLLGFTAVKGGAYLRADIKPKLTGIEGPWALETEFYFGGFAKYNDELISFMNDFYNQFRIPLDIVYTGKLMYGLFQLIGQDYFPGKSKIIAIHTGGLQGNSLVKSLLHYL